MTDKANSTGNTRKGHGRDRLLIPDTVFSGETVRLIVDKWLVPTLLEEFLRTKTLRTGAKQEHNGEPFP
jgi:hypothetical protein